MKYSIEEFAQEIRKLYPGDYDDLSDRELVDKWLRRYPGDREKVQLDSPFQGRKIPEPESRPDENSRITPGKNHENKFQGLSDELSMSVHKSKTFVLPAIITLVLYYIGFFIVGFIVNLLYISSANNNRIITGSNPPGRGCLVFLLWFHIILLLVILVLFAAGINIFADIFNL